MEVKEVRPSREDSVERLFHAAGQPRAVLRSRQRRASCAAACCEPRLERFIGVIYRPETELQSHYAEVELPRPVRRLCLVRPHHAVTPLPTAQRPGMPETYPFGL